MKIDRAKLAEERRRWRELKRWIRELQRRGDARIDKLRKMLASGELRP